MMPLPPVLQKAGPPEVAFRLSLDADLMAFQGHFPGLAVLPGVVQVDWAVQLAEATFGSLGDFRGIKGLKFQGLIQPGDAVELRLRHQPDCGELSFEYFDGPERKSLGTLQFSSRG